MPSCTKEQREAALRELEECGGSVIQVIRRRGYPSRQTMYQWINQADASRQLTAGRPWSHYDPALKKEAVRLVSEGMDGGGVASALGVSSAAAACNWVRSSETAKEREASMPKSPIDDGSRAYDGFDGDESERIRQLELENDILREALIHLKGCGLERMTNREKTAIIDSPRPKTGRALKGPAASLRISKSSYGYRRAAIARKDKHGDLRGKIARIFEGAGRTRGYRFVTHEPRSLGEPIVVSEKAVRRIMSGENRVVIYNKKAEHCSFNKGEISDAPPNLVKRDFHSALPNRFRLTDITGFGIPAGKACPSPVPDCFDGALAAWSISTAPDAEPANSMPRAACAKLSPDGHPVIHGDRGCRYRWPGWISICKEHGLARSMSAKGCSPDNSAMEGFFGRLKNEFFYGRNRQGVSPQEFSMMLDAYLVYYNERRLKESLGWLSPMQFRRSLGLAA